MQKTLPRNSLRKACKVVSGKYFKGLGVKEKSFNPKVSSASFLQIKYNIHKNSRMGRTNQWIEDESFVYSKSAIESENENDYPIFFIHDQVSHRAQPEYPLKIKMHYFLSFICRPFRASFTLNGCTIKIGRLLCI